MTPTSLGSRRDPVAERYRMASARVTKEKSRCTDRSGSTCPSSMPPAARPYPIDARRAARQPNTRTGQPSLAYGHRGSVPTRPVIVRSPDWEPIRCPRDEVDRHAGLMPRKLSAGLLLYRRGNQDDEIVLEVLLAHMGGPFWAQKDDGAWSIPKGEYESGEDPFVAAKREFEEELGSVPPLVVYRDLGSVSQPGGKLVTAWAAEADFDAAGAVSNTFELEWPRGSRQMRSFPEIDKAGWFTVEVARVKLVRGQQPLIDRLLQMLGNLG